MTPITRAASAAGTAALLSLSLSACGGEGAPTDASKADYCEVVQQGMGDGFAEAIRSGDWEKVVDRIKEIASEVEEVGTPDDISDEEREGFELQLERLEGISEEDLEQAMEDEDAPDPLTEGFDEDDQKKVDAYDAYQQETCA